MPPVLLRRQGWLGCRVGEQVWPGNCPCRAPMSPLWAMHPSMAIR